MEHQDKRPDEEFLSARASKPVLAANIAAAVAYFFFITFWFPRGNPLLFAMLVLGEIYHVWQILTYCFTVWHTEEKDVRFDPTFMPTVDVFITVAGEPVDVVRRTALAAKNMDYPDHFVWILNDGLVAKKENWQDIEQLAADIGVGCITRTVPGGAKAGNINSGLRVTEAPYFVIFDADHAPHADFLASTMGYLADWRVAYVQTPQYYANHAANDVTGGSWEQQQLFFGPICRGKNMMNSVPMCGTNMVIRRKAILEVGGMAEENIAEDFLTSLFMHEHGWRSHYVPRVLAEGLAPEDFMSYSKQQYRWARGSLEVLFRYNPLFHRGLTWKQKVQYLASASYWVSGVIILLNALFPLIFFFTGAVPLKVSTMALALAFLPYMFLTIVTLRISSNYSYTYRALAFSMGTFMIHVKAVVSALTGQKSTFEVTSKRKLEGTFLQLVVPHITYCLLALSGTIVALARDGMTASVAANIAWAFFNSAIFIPYILAIAPAGSLDLTRFFRKAPEMVSNIEEQLL